MEFEEAIEYVLGHEGGYANNPNDAGGETNWGISKRAFPWINIKLLTRSEAIELYREYYWNKLRCNSMPAGIRLHLLDFGVNAGVAQCAKTLQGLLGIKKDSIIGAITIRNAQKVTPWMFAEARSKHYVGLVKSKPSQIEFLNGWLLRNLEITRVCVLNG